MDYVSQLEDKELEIICGVITPKEIRNFFQRNPKEYNKIWKVRAIKLSDDAVISIVCRNRKSAFISDFINGLLERYMNEIGLYIERNIESGEDSGSATLRVLRECVFAEHISIYFKLKCIKEGTPSVPSEYIYMIQEAIDGTSDEHAKPGELENWEWELELDAAKETISDLAHQLEDCRLEREAEKEKRTKLQQTLSGQIAAASLELKKARSESKKLLDELEDAKKTIAEQQTEIQKRTAENSTDENVEQQFEYTSLCMVEECDYMNHNKRLVRLADISNGKLETFIFNENMPPYFGNRDLLYWSDGPEAEGEIGVWNWNATPSYNDPSKDYNTTEYNPFLAPTEIIELTGTTIDSIINSLHNGVDATPCCTQILFCVHLPKQSSKSLRMGLLCSRSQLETAEGKTYLRAEVFALKQYNFTSQDIFRVNGKKFFKTFEIGEETGIVQVRNPLAAVKGIILRRATWNEFKQRGTIKNDWRKLCDFLFNIPDTTVYQDIADACGCDEETAKEYTNLFVQKAEEYLDSNDIDEQVLAAAMQNHSQIFERCNQIAEQKWRTEHQQKIRDAEKQLETVLHQGEQKRLELTQCAAGVSDAQKKLDTINAAISEKEQFAQSVDDKVTAKIEEARKNAADFLSEMAFRFPAMAAAPAADRTSAQKVPQLYHEGEVLDSDTLEQCDNWKDLIDVIAEELSSAGISSNYNRGLAAYMYSAYVNKTPLLFAGPCGQEIADAFSAALFGKTADYVNCMDGYHPEIAETLLENDEPLVVLNSPFGSEWISRLPSMLMNTGKYFILTHPFAEDMLIEPHSLYHYCLPVLTELIVDDMPEGRYIGGCMSGSFADYQKKKSQLFHNRLLKSMHMGTLARARLQQILTDMHTMESTQNADYDCLFGLLPYAYMTGNVDLFTEKLNEEGQRDMPVSKDLRSVLLSFTGKDE